MDWKLPFHFHHFLLSQLTWLFIFSCSEKVEYRHQMMAAEEDVNIKRIPRILGEQKPKGDQGTILTDKIPVITSDGSVYPSPTLVPYVDRPIQYDEGTIIPLSQRLNFGVAATPLESASHLALALERDAFKDMRVGSHPVPSVPTPISSILGVDKNENALVVVSKALYAFGLATGELKGPYSGLDGKPEDVISAWDCPASERYVYLSKQLSNSRPILYSIDYNLTKLVQLSPNLDASYTNISVSGVSNNSVLSTYFGSGKQTLVSLIGCGGEAPKDISTSLGGDLQVTSDVFKLSDGKYYFETFNLSMRDYEIVNIDSMGLVKTGIKSKGKFSVSSTGRLATRLPTGIFIYSDPKGAPVLAMGLVGNADPEWDPTGRYILLQYVENGLNQYRVFDSLDKSVQNFRNNLVFTHASKNFYITNSKSLVRQVNYNQKSSIIAFQVDDTPLLAASRDVLQMFEVDIQNDWVMYVSRENQDRVVMTVDLKEAKEYQSPFNLVNSEIFLDPAAKKIYTHSYTDIPGQSAILQSNFDFSQYASLTVFYGSRCKDSLTLRTTPLKKYAFYLNSTQGVNACRLSALNLKNFTAKTVPGYLNTLSSLSLHAGSIEQNSSLYVMGQFEFPGSNGVYGLNLLSGIFKETYSSAGDLSSMIPSSENGLVVSSQQGPTSKLNFWSSSNESRTTVEFSQHVDFYGGSNAGFRFANGKVLYTATNPLTKRYEIFQGEQGDFTKITDEGTNVKGIMRQSKDNMSLGFTLELNGKVSLYITDGVTKTLVSQDDAVAEDWFFDSNSKNVVFRESGAGQNDKVFIFDLVTKTRRILFTGDSEIKRILYYNNSLVVVSLNSALRVSMSGEVIRNLLDLSGKTVIYPNIYYAKKFLAIPERKAAGDLLNVLNLDIDAMVTSPIISSYCGIGGISDSGDAAFLAGTFCKTLYVQKFTGELYTVNSATSLNFTKLQMLSQSDVVFQATGEGYGIESVYLWRFATKSIEEIVRTPFGSRVSSVAVDETRRDLYFTANVMQNQIFSLYKKSIP